MSPASYRAAPPRVGRTNLTRPDSERQIRARTHHQGRARADDGYFDVDGFALGEADFRYSVDNRSTSAWACPAAARLPLL